MNSRITIAPKVAVFPVAERNQVFFMPIEKWPVLYAPMAGTVEIVSYTFGTTIRIVNGESWVELGYGSFLGSTGSGEIFVTTGDSVYSGDPLCFVYIDTMREYKITSDRNYHFPFARCSSDLDIYSLTGIPRSAQSTAQNGTWLLNAYIEINTPAGLLSKYRGKVRLANKYVKVTKSGNVESASISYILRYYNPGDVISISDLKNEAGFADAVIDSRTMERLVSGNITVGNDNLFITASYGEMSKNSRTFSDTANTVVSCGITFHSMGGDVSVNESGTYYLNMGKLYNAHPSQTTIYSRYRYMIPLPVYDYGNFDPYFSFGSTSIGAYYDLELSLYKNAVDFGDDDFKKIYEQSYNKWTCLYPVTSTGKTIPQNNELIVWWDTKRNEYTISEYTSGTPVNPPYTKKDGYKIEWRIEYIGAGDGSSEKTDQTHTATSNRGTIYRSYYSDTPEPGVATDSIIPILMMLSSRGIGMPCINKFNTYINKT